MTDSGLATERTRLSRRRTVLPFLVVALLGARAALDAPIAGLTIALLAGVGAVVARLRLPTLLAAVVLLLAVAGALLPAPD